MHRSKSCLVLALAAAALAGCGDSEGNAQKGNRPPESDVAAVPLDVQVPGGPPPQHLRVIDLEKGTGPGAGPGDDLTVRFAAKRWNGEPFQSSWDNGHFEPFTFELHSKPPQVIPGWERGMLGMRVGGRRKLIVPASLIYHPGQGSERPPQPDEALVYVVDLLRLHSHGRTYRAPV